MSARQIPKISLSDGFLEAFAGTQQGRSPTGRSLGVPAAFASPSWTPAVRFGVQADLGFSLGCPRACECNEGFCVRAACRSFSRPATVNPFRLHRLAIPAATRRGFFPAFGLSDIVVGIHYFPLHQRGHFSYGPAAVLCDEAWWALPDLPAFPCWTTWPCLCLLPSGPPRPVPTAVILSTAVRLPPRRLRPRRSFRPQQT